MRAGVWMWALVGLLAWAPAGRADSWVVDGEARGPVKEKSTVWSLGIGTNAILFLDGAALGSMGSRPSWRATGTNTYVGLALQAESAAAQATADAAAVAIAGLGSRLSRTEIDLLNNYLNDATAYAVSMVPLLWGVADTFVDTNYISVLSDVTHNVADECLEFDNRPAIASGGTPNLIDWMKFDDSNSERRVENSAVGGVDGVLTNGPTTAEASRSDAIVGSSLYLAANNDVINLYTNLTRSDNSKGSVAFWYKTDSVGHDYAPTFGNDSNILNLGGRWHDGGQYYAMFTMNYAPYYECDGFYPVGYDFIGEWHHLAMTQDGSKIRAYWDAVEVTDDLYFPYGDENTSVWFATFPDTEQLRFGTLNIYGIRPWSGWVDDFRITTNVWTANDVAWIYNSGAGQSIEDGGAGLPAVELAYAVTSNRVWTISADEAYVSAQVEVPESGLTNVAFLASITDPPAWVEIPVGVDNVLPGGILSVSGSTNFPSAGTNLSVRVEVTNTFEGVRLHGLGYGRR